MLGPFWMANIALLIVNAVLLAVLLTVYVKNFGQIRSKFALGLIAFASLFLIDNLAAAYLYFGLAQAYGAAVATPLLAINLIAVLGFVTLLWTTIR